MTQLTNEAVEHSRFNPDHYNKCAGCYDAAMDFIQESNADAELDAQAEREENEHEYDPSY